MSNEEKRKRKQAASLSTCLMFHALKVRFSESQDQSLFLGWRNTIKTKSNKVKNILQKHPSSRQHLQTNLVFIYDNALKQYREESNSRSDLVNGIQYLPKECPWTVSDLTKSVSEIVGKI